VQRVSLIEEGPVRKVRMAHLAVVGSHSTNGVAAIHSDLLRTRVLNDFAELFPARFNNKTNGVTPRRWLQQANPFLSQLITRTIGEDWITNLAELRYLATLSDDPDFREQFREAKRAAKAAFANWLKTTSGQVVDPNSIFDSQIKRIHEYKRQLLNILDAIARYRAILADPGGDWVPRVKIFSGKAAPSYSRAKLIIKLANDVANVINNDPLVGDLLKIVFLPNYNVSLAELIIPSADLSEQISTAGMEASGTGNMKLALNGALTIGTFDGANIEISEHVGEENIFIFGLRAAQVADRRRRGLDATKIIAASPDLSNVVDAVATGCFSPEDPDRFAGLVNILRHSDPYMIAVDFDAYREAQRGVDELWRSSAKWCRAALLNIAGMSWFSSDRAIAQYAEEIWDIPIPGKPA
jgi:starch phosphorylase